jgi:hypothetical protein
VALIKTDYEEEKLQPTPAGHPKGKLLSTGFSMVRSDKRDGITPSMRAMLSHLITYGCLFCLSV